MKKKLVMISIITIFIIFGNINFFIKKEQKEYVITDSNPSLTSNEMIKNPIHEEYVERNTNKVTMLIKDKTLTQTSATIIIIDSNEYPYSYNEEFRIDKKENGQWKKLKQISETFSKGIAVIPEKSNSFEYDVDWNKQYGKLRKGEYRLVKEVYDKVQKYIFVEFTIK